MCCVLIQSSADLYKNIKLEIDHQEYTLKDLQEIHALLSIIENLLMKNSEDVIDKKLQDLLSSKISSSDLSKYTLLLSIISSQNDNANELEQLEAQMEKLYKAYAIKYNIRKKNFYTAMKIQALQLNFNQHTKALIESKIKPLQEHNEYIASQQEALMENNVFGYNLHLIEMKKTEANLALISVIETAFNEKPSTIQVQALCSKYSIHPSKDSANGLGVYMSKYIPAEFLKILSCKRNLKKAFPCMHTIISEDRIYIYFATNKYSNSQINLGKTFQEQLAQQLLLQMMHIKNAKVIIRINKNLIQ